MNGKNISWGINQNMSLLSCHCELMCAADSVLLHFYLWDLTMDISHCAGKWQLHTGTDLSRDLSLMSIIYSKCGPGKYSTGLLCSCLCYCLLNRGIFLLQTEMGKKWLQLCSAFFWLLHSYNRGNLSVW